MEIKAIDNGLILKISKILMQRTYLNVANASDGKEKQMAAIPGLPLARS